jgi:hypothetical protein
MRQAAEQGVEGPGLHGGPTRDLGLRAEEIR